LWRTGSGSLAAGYIGKNLAPFFCDPVLWEIQAAKARATGYATHDNLIAIACLLCAKLKHLPRNPWLTATAA